MNYRSSHILAVEQGVSVCPRIIFLHTFKLFSKLQSIYWINILWGKIIVCGTTSWHYTHSSCSSSSNPYIDSIFCEVRLLSVVLHHDIIPGFSTICWSSHFIETNTVCCIFKDLGKDVMCRLIFSQTDWITIRSVGCRIKAGMILWLDSFSQVVWK